MNMLTTLIVEFVVGTIIVLTFGSLMDLAVKVRTNFNLRKIYLPIEVRFVGLILVIATSIYFY